MCEGSAGALDASGRFHGGGGPSQRISAVQMKKRKDAFHSEGMDIPITKPLICTIIEQTLKSELNPPSTPIRVVWGS